MVIHFWLIVFGISFVSVHLYLRIRAVLVDTIRYLMRHFMIKFKRLPLDISVIRMSSHSSMFWHIMIKSSSFIRLNLIIVKQPIYSIRWKKTSNQVFILLMSFGNTCTLSSLLVTLTSDEMNDLLHPPCWFFIWIK